MLIARGRHVLEHACDFFFICLLQLLLQGLFSVCAAVPTAEVYTFFPFLASLLSRWPSQRKDSKLCLLHSFLTPFPLCQIGAGQFHPLHVSVICTSVSTLKHICVCFQAEMNAKLWSWGFRWVVPSLKMFVSQFCTVLALTVCQNAGFFQRSQRSKQCPVVVCSSAVRWLHDLDLSAFAGPQRLRCLSLVLVNNLLGEEGSREAVLFFVKRMTTVTSPPDNGEKYWGIPASFLSPFELPI